MSNVARNQLGIQPEVLRNIDMQKRLATHDLHVGQHVMHQDSVTEWWNPAIITSLCQEKWSYKIKTSDSVSYQKTQAHLKPYTSQNKQPVSQPNHKQPMAQLDHKWLVIQLMP